MWHSCNSKQVASSRCVHLFLGHCQLLKLSQIKMLLTYHQLSILSQTGFYTSETTRVTYIPPSEKTHRETGSEKSGRWGLEKKYEAEKGKFRINSGWCNEFEKENSESKKSWSGRSQEEENFHGGLPLTCHTVLHPMSFLFLISVSDPCLSLNGTLHVQKLKVKDNIPYCTSYIIWINSFNLSSTTFWGFRVAFPAHYNSKCMHTQNTQTNYFFVLHGFSQSNYLFREALWDSVWRRVKELSKKIKINK